MQRMTRGALAREFKRRALRSKALLHRAIGSAQVVADLDAALQAHTETMAAMELLFSVPFPELAEVRTLRAAMQLWFDLELELTALLGEHAKGGAPQEAADDAIEVAAPRARACSPIHDSLQPHARKLAARRYSDGRAALDLLFRWQSYARSGSRTCGATQCSGSSTSQRAPCSTPTWASCSCHRRRRRCGCSTRPRWRRPSRRRVRARLHLRLCFSRRRRCVSAAQHTHCMVNTAGAAAEVQRSRH